jgi:hypothetical protein
MIWKLPSLSQILMDSAPSNSIQNQLMRSWRKDVKSFPTKWTLDGAMHIPAEGYWKCLSVRIHITEWENHLNCNNFNQNSAKWVKPEQVVVMAGFDECEKYILQDLKAWGLLDKDNRPVYAHEDAEPVAEPLTQRENGEASMSFASFSCEKDSTGMAWRRTSQRQPRIRFQKQNKKVELRKKYFAELSTLDELLDPKSDPAAAKDMLRSKIILLRTLTQTEKYIPEGSEAKVMEFRWKIMGLKEEVAKAIDLLDFHRVLEHWESSQYSFAELVSLAKKAFKLFDTDVMPTYFCNACGIEVKGDKTKHEAGSKHQRNMKDQVSQAVAASKLQGWIRVLIAVHHKRSKARAAILVQSWIRAVFKRSAFLECRRSAIRLQSFARLCAAKKKVLAVKTASKRERDQLQREINARLIKSLKSKAQAERDTLQHIINASLKRRAKPVIVASAPMCTFIPSLEEAVVKFCKKAYVQMQWDSFGNLVVFKHENNDAKNERIAHHLWRKHGGHVNRLDKDGLLRDLHLQNMSQIWQYA